MPEWTPGPWYYGKLPDIQGCPRYGLAQETNGRDVCNILFADPTFKTEESNKADARLMAAAPELLEACQYLCAEIHNRSRGEAFERGVRMAEAIIDKAKGENQSL